MKFNKHKINDVTIKLPNKINDVIMKSYNHEIIDVIIKNKQTQLRHNDKKRKINDAITTSRLYHVTGSSCLFL